MNILIIKDTISDSIGCGSTITLPSGTQQFSSYYNFQCNPGGNTPEIFWSVTDQNSNIIASSSTLPLSFNPIEGNNYTCIMTSICCGHACDTCKFTINYQGDCCRAFITTVTKQELSYNSDDEVFLLKNLVTTNPNMIKEISATIVSSSSRVFSPSSTVSAVAGCFTGATSDIGTFNLPYCKTVRWSTGVPVDIIGKTLDLSLAFNIGTYSMGRIMPRHIQDSLKFCIRYTFTDTNCITCDTLICYSFVRTTSLLKKKVVIRNEMLKLKQFDEREEKTEPEGQGRKESNNSDIIISRNKYWLQQ